MEDFAEKLNNPEFTGNADHWDLVGGASYLSNAIKVLLSGILDKLNETSDLGSDISSIFVLGNFLYACENALTSRVFKLNISDLSVAVTSADLGINLSGVFAFGDYVYVVGYDRKIFKLQVSDLTKVDESDAVSLYGYLTSIFISGNYIYVCHYEYAGGYIFKVNLSDLTIDTVSDDLGGSLGKLFVSGEYVYVGRGDRVLKLNVSDLSVAVTSVDLGSNVVSVFVSGDYVYASEAQFVHKLRISDLVQVSGSSPLVAAFSSELYVSGDYVYVSSWYGKVYKLNTSDLSKVAESDKLIIGNLNTVFVLGDYIYTSSTESGVITKVFKLSTVTSASISQPIIEMVTPLTIGNKEEITIVISGYVKGSVIATCGGVTIATLSSNGTHVNEFLVVDDEEPVTISSSVATELVIESVSLKRYASKLKVYVDGIFQLKPIKIYKTDAFINCVVRKYNGTDFEDI